MSTRPAPSNNRRRPRPKLPASKCSLARESAAAGTQAARAAVGSRNPAAGRWCRPCRNPADPDWPLRPDRRSAADCRHTASADCHTAAPEREPLRALPVRSNIAEVQVLVPQLEPVRRCCRSERGRHRSGPDRHRMLPESASAAPAAGSGRWTPAGRSLCIRQKSATRSARLAPDIPTSNSSCSYWCVLSPHRDANS